MKNHLKTRDLSYEFIRVLAMIFIVFDHNLNSYIQGDLSKYIEPFFVVGVTLFFMLSGKFAFKLNLEDKSLYKKFYWKKFIGLIIPILVFMAIKNLHVMVYNWHLSVTPISYLRHFGIALVNGFNYMEYWFLYILIALLAAVPFTARMMQSMKDRDKKAFLIVSTIFGIFQVFIPTVFKVDFAVNYYFLGYVLFFFIGFIAEDVFSSQKDKKRLYFIGLLGFIITLIMVHFGFKSGYKSFSPFYLYFTLALFIGLHELGKKIPKKFEKLIGFIGKHSLSVYMIHIIFLYIINDLNFFPKNILSYILSTFSTVIISAIIGAIIDKTIIKWIQNLFIKIFKLENVLK